MESAALIAEKFIFFFLVSFDYNENYLIKNYYLT